MEVSNLNTKYNQALVHVLDHPLIQDKLNKARDKNTEDGDFRRYVQEIAMLMVYECTRNLSLVEKSVTTPVSTAKLKFLKPKAISIVSILRAGNGLLEGMLKVLPNACVGHIGMARDEKTFKPNEYYYKVPSNDPELLIVVDPMLATANTAVDSLSRLKKDFSCPIIFVSLLAAPEGLANLTSSHPDVNIYVGSVDEKLNEAKYIVMTYQP